MFAVGKREDGIILRCANARAQKLSDQQLIYRSGVGDSTPSPLFWGVFSSTAAAEEYFDIRQHTCNSFQAFVHSGGRSGEYTVADEYVLRCA